jgi:hypothetical protein
MTGFVLSCAVIAPTQRGRAMDLDIHQGQRVDLNANDSHLMHSGSKICRSNIPRFCEGCPE